MAGINLNDIRNSNTTLVKVKWTTNRGNSKNLKIQIQHLLKLNAIWNTCLFLKIFIQIQHLLKLNLKIASDSSSSSNIQIQHLLKLNLLQN